jgi:hypothetical protein
VIAALYVQTGGCYVGLYGPVSDIILSADAAQRPCRSETISVCLSEGAPGGGRRANTTLEAGSPRRKCATVTLLAQNKSGNETRKESQMACQKSRPRAGNSTGLASEKQIFANRKAQGRKRSRQFEISRNDNRGLRTDACRPGRRLCDLRIKAGENAKRQAPLRRSLPQKRQSARTSLLSLQFIVEPSRRFIGRAAPRRRIFGASQ